MQAGRAFKRTKENTVGTLWGRWSLLKISEFAALSGISRQLLIYYDNQGILHPKQVDVLYVQAWIAPFP